MSLAAALTAPSDPHLADRVHSAFETSAYMPLKRVRVEAADGSVRIHGRVGSYFEKQMAQEIVRRLDGVERIENLLEVAW